MTFRETIAAEPLDLVETVFCKCAGIAPFDQVVDHLRLELADRADIAERRHGAAQPVGLFGRKLRSLDGDTHCLFLELRHTKGLMEDPAQFILVAMRGRRRRIIHPLYAIPPPKI